MTLCACIEALQIYHAAGLAMTNSFQVRATWSVACFTLHSPMRFGAERARFAVTGETLRLEFRTKHSAKCIFIGAGFLGSETR